MKFVSFVAIACLIWQLVRLLRCLPEVVEAVWYTASGEEKRDVEARQKAAIDRRIAKMREQLEKWEADHPEYSARFANTPEHVRASAEALYQGRKRLIHSNCDSDINKIKKSYWGYVE